MKPPEIISTVRLILRKPSMDDAPAVFAGWVQDSEVTYFLTWLPHKNIGQTESMLTRAIAAWDGDSRFPYMITLKESGTVIGMIDPQIEGHKIAIGYVMNKDYQGKGYMTEATRAIIDWAFGQQSIYRVYATTDVENFASQRVLEKAGMQREGLLRKYIVHPNISDVPRDSYMYAIVK
ncbi:MAG: GNAT family N-acetyltransferase [Anaerolineales bacterium]|nr:GNAT family N-acetyltransferase [Anaerolineales bacterium]